MPENVNKNRFNLRSEEVQEIISNPPVWIVRWGITLIFVFTFIIIAISFFIKYPDFVSAKVLITTELPTERIVARNSGQLEMIFVQNGDRITSGQNLGIIRNTADFNDIYLLKRLIHSRQVSGLNFTFPIDSTTNLILGEVEEAYINFEKSYLDYLLFKELEPYDNQILGNNKSQREMQIQLFAQMQQKRLLEQEYDIKKTDFERHEKLYEKGVISQQEFGLKEMEFIEMKKSVNSMAISISQIHEAISNSNQLISSTLINRQEDKTKFSKNLAQSMSILKKAIRDWEYNYLLTSSIDGVISFQQFWGLNQFISSGDIIFSILPEDTSKLVGKLMISAQNSGKVTIGQKVLVKLDNFPYHQYGMLLGRVENMSVSPDRENNYVVYIALPRGLRTSYNATLDYKQELLGNAEIITEELSLAERLFYKFREVFKYG